MKTSDEWLSHFKSNARIQRINWYQIPRLSSTERTLLLPSLKAWQLGETSEGRHLLNAAEHYSEIVGDVVYPEVVKLFILEEQKHGNNLGQYLDMIGEERLKYNWGDSLFRKVRYFCTSMEIWTLAVLTVESSAQIFYQCLKDACACPLLKEICTDILIDEADHIRFQYERMSILFQNKSAFEQKVSKLIYRMFFVLTTRVIWFAHKNVFTAGGNSRKTFIQKMDRKYFKTFGRLERKNVTQKIELEIVSS